MGFSPPEQTLKLTKQQGAHRQVQAAIVALRDGDFDVAITLAGAAEGMLPEKEDQPLFSGVVESPNRPDSISRKKLIQMLNLERDWLKHSSPQFPDQIEINLFEASHMIARAMSRLDEWTWEMHEFRRWFMGYIRR